jgi:hypothetical protein
MESSKNTLLHHLYLVIKNIELSYDKDKIILIQRCPDKNTYMFPSISIKHKFLSHKISILKLLMKYNSYYKFIEMCKNKIIINLSDNQIWPTLTEDITGNTTDNFFKTISGNISENTINQNIIDNDNIISI